MKLRIVSFGHKRDEWFAPAVAEYQKRISKPWSIELVDLPSARRSESEPAATVMSKEAEALSKSGVTADTCWALVVGGDAITTEQLAEQLGRLADTGMKQVSFVIGGADGLDPKFASAARKRMSLSKLTLPHRLARVVLIEQLYRAQTILRGEPYHK